MKTLKRRDFIKTGLIAGGAVILSNQISGAGIFNKPAVSFQPPADGEMPDIVSVSGDTPEESMARLLEPLGGIGKFVRPGQTVGLLVNSPWKNRGYYTQPDIVLSLANLCLQAGAKKIICFQPVPQGYWQRGRLSEKFKPVIEGIGHGSDQVEVAIPGGVSLKKAKIYIEFKEADVLSACLWPNIMQGLSSRAT